MPWIHFHAGDDGLVQACCVARIPFGNINDQSFNEIWNGSSINALRDKFKSGKSDKRCAQCIHIEKAGGKSIRQETHEKFSHINPQKTTLPIYFDIRFSNVCNLKCRTCWHGASSAWFDDAKKLNANKGNKAVIQNVEDFDRFISEIGPSLKNAQEIYLAGGEPLVTEAHYLLLEWLIENKITSPLLRYNTNFMQLGFKKWDVLKLWEKFDRIEIMASVDGIDELGKYIRSKNFDWNKFKSNRVKIKDYPNLSFKVTPTISVLSLEGLPQLISTLLEMNMVAPNDIYFNILERPIQYNIQILPQVTKSKVQIQMDELQQKLKVIPNTEHLLKNIEEVIQYMNQNDQSKNWSKFEAYNSKIDEIRNEKFPFQID